MIWIAISWAIVAFGQPGWVPWLGSIAALCGYTLFWRAFQNFPSRFWSATLWYAAVQAIQLSWMTSIEYQGVYILFVYACVCLVLGLQFGVLSLLITAKEKMTVMRILAIAALWTVMEWGRFHVLCGFSFNPAGLALTGFLSSLQMAAVWGVLGLSFYVMLVNLWAFSGRSFKMLAALALFPYLFGYAHLAYHGKDLARSPILSAALVQTNLLPSEKTPLKGRLNAFISPIHQWQRILGFLEDQARDQWDLIVLPESALPFTSDAMVYPLEFVVEVLESSWGSSEGLPPLSYPFAEKKEKGWQVSNAFWAQALANHYRAEVVAGLDQRDKVLKKNYTAAFHFLPDGERMRRYEKRVLVPLAEYLPFNWLMPWVQSYGVTEFFTPGTEAKVFGVKIPFSPSICYEETFPDLMREGRRKGAELLVNVTNDNWYPASRLPEQHFSLGRLRAIENGVPLIRACNTGVTASVDSLGRTLAQMDLSAGALAAPFKTYHYKTLYTHWGDAGIIGLCLIILTCFLRLKKRFGW
jgi:apolipoprotein N-acyltransferase